SMTLAPTTLHPLSLHDALPISPPATTSPPADPKAPPDSKRQTARTSQVRTVSYVLIHHTSRANTRHFEHATAGRRPARALVRPRSEEHTSELQSRENLVCRLLL